MVAHIRHNEPMTELKRSPVCRQITPTISARHYITIPTANLYLLLWILNVPTMNLDNEF